MWVSGIAPISLTSALNEGDWSASRLSRSTLGERAPGGWALTVMGTAEKRRISYPYWVLNPLQMFGQAIMTNPKVHISNKLLQLAV